METLYRQLSYTAPLYALHKICASKPLLELGVFLPSEQKKYAATKYWLLLHSHYMVYILFQQFPCSRYSKSSSMMQDLIQCQVSSKRFAPLSAFNISAFMPFVKNFFQAGQSPIRAIQQPAGAPLIHEPFPG